MSSGVLPFDVYCAAEFFLETGMTPGEVLPRLSLSEAAWRQLHSAYFDQFHDSDYLWRLQQLYPDLPADRLLAGLAGPRWQPPGGEPPFHWWARGIRKAVHERPHIGPFAGLGWQATFITFDPVGWLRYYSHDGERVYHCGRPLADKTGAPVEVDAPAFRHIGGRFYGDGRHILAQGERGGVTVRSHFWILQEADPASFQALNLRYAKDRQRVWYITGKEIRSRSPEAFEVLPRVRLNYRDETCEQVFDTSVFARDAEHVYHFGDRLNGARPAGFRDLGHDYAADGTTVWFLGSRKPVAGADASSFIVPGPGEPYVEGDCGGAAVTDRFRSYERGLPVDPAEAFERWRPFFAARADLAGWWWHLHLATNPD